MNTIIFSQNKGLKELTLEPTFKIGDLIKEAIPATAGIPDTLEDQEVYVLDHDQELSKDDAVKERNAFVIHRCKKIIVTILYAGLTYTHKYPPSKLIKHIRKDAIEKLNIDGPTAQSLELFEKQEQNAKVNRNYPIGYYSDYPTCGIQFYLAEPNAFAG